MKVLDNARKDLPAYAWPGGYPIMYLAHDGWRETVGECEPPSNKLDFNEHDRSENICCAQCAADVQQWPDIIIVAEFIHYEGSPEYCEYCNSFTGSAYGDPEEQKVECKGDSNP